MCAVIIKQKQMIKAKKLKFDNKTIIAIGVAIVLLALIIWGTLAQSQRLHDAPTVSLTKISNIDRLKPDMFYPVCDPLRDIGCEKEIYEKKVLDTKTDDKFRFEEIDTTTKRR